MAGEIAEAFVLIRPNTTGFKQQTEAETKSAALGAAKVFAAAFAGVKLFDFAKSAVQEAAATQKATEGIKAGFGDASEGVLHFADTAASKLGISKQASEQFSASLAIQAKNLGIGQEKASEMSIGLQKLAGSVGAIKGIDPASVFDRLSVALLGNTRGLKSLGISADAASISQAALDNHIVKATVNQAEVTKKTEAYKTAVTDAQKAVEKYGKGSAEAASAQNKAALAQQAVQKALAGTVPKLDAAQKAQAIYAVATKQLGDFQQQAAKHSNDLANEQIKLSAEWQNAKETIGAALLPAVTALATELVSLLDTVQRDKKGFETAFHDIGLVISPVTFAIKGLAHESQVTIPVIAGLVGAFAAYKTVSIAARVSTAIYNDALKAWKVTAAIARGEVTLFTGATEQQAAANQQAAVAAEEQALAARAQATALAEAAAATAAESVELEGTTAAMAASVAAAEAHATAMAGAAVADEAEAAAAAAATVATEELDVALASNPFGLVALGISAVVGGLIGFKVLAGESGKSTSALDRDFQGLASSLTDVKNATNDAHDALLGLFQAEISTKQSEKELADANHKLAAAVREKSSADTIYKDQLAVVNALEKDGQKGTPAFEAAIAKLTDAKRKLGAATRAEGDAQLTASQALAANTENLDQLTSKLEVAGKTAGGLRTQAEDLATTFRTKLATAAGDTSQALNVFQLRGENAGRTSIVNAAKVAQFARGMGDLASKARDTAKAINTKADADQKLADQISKLNPKLGNQAQQLVNAERAAAQSALKTAGMDLATQHLTASLGHVPTTRQINVYFKRNMNDLLREVRDLGQSVNNLPSSKVIDVNIVRRGTGNVDTRKAGGGTIQPGQVALTGEQGPEISVSSASRQVISHGQSVALFADLARAIDKLTVALTPHAAPIKQARSAPLVENLTITEAGDARRTAQKILDELALAVPR